MIIATCVYCENTFDTFNIEEYFCEECFLNIHSKIFDIDDNEKTDWKEEGF